MVLENWESYIQQASGSHLSVTMREAWAEETLKPMPTGTHFFNKATPTSIRSYLLIMPLPSGTFFLQTTTSRIVKQFGIIKELQKVSYLQSQGCNRVRELKILWYWHKKQIHWSNLSVGIMLHSTWPIENELSDFFWGSLSPNLLCQGFYFFLSIFLFNI